MPQKSKLKETYACQSMVAIETSKSLSDQTSCQNVIRQMWQLATKFHLWLLLGY